MLIDGLGTTLLREHAASAPFLSSLPGIDDVVCGVPSTTATSLTSLGTGLAPASTAWSATPAGCRPPASGSTPSCGTSRSCPSSGSRTAPCSS